MHNGVHSPGWVDDEVIEKLKSGNFHAIYMFSFQPVEDYLRIKAEIPDVRFGVRAWTNWNEWPDPLQWGRTIATYLIALTRAGIQPDFVSLGNEPNNELGSDDDSARRFNDWFVQAYTVVRSHWACSSVPIAFPALCPSLRIWEWRQLCNQAMSLSDVLNCHTYWQNEEMLDNDYEGHSAHWWSEQFPDKPLYITECGMADGVDREERARLYPIWMEQVKSIRQLQWYAWFILDSRDHNWIEKGCTFDETMLDAVNEATLST